jgi:hypothetical protein
MNPNQQVESIHFLCVPRITTVTHINFLLLCWQFTNKIRAAQQNRKIRQDKRRFHGASDPVTCYDVWQPGNIWITLWAIMCPCSTTQYWQIRMFFSIYILIKLRRNRCDKCLITIRFMQFSLALNENAPNSLARECTYTRARART